MTTQIVLIKDGELDFNIDNVQDQFTLTDEERNYYLNIAVFLKKEKIRYFYCDGSKRSLQIFDIIQQEQKKQMQKQYVSSYVKISKQILKNTSMYQFMNNIRMLINEITMTEKKFVLLVANGYIINQIAYYLFQMQKDENIGKWSFYNGQYNTLKLVYQNPNAKKDDAQTENNSSLPSTQNLTQLVTQEKSTPDMGLQRVVTNPDITNVVQPEKRPATAFNSRPSIKQTQNLQQDQQNNSPIAESLEIKPLVDSDKYNDQTLDILPLQNHDGQLENSGKLNQNNYANISKKFKFNDSYDMYGSTSKSQYKEPKDQYAKMHIKSLESFLHQTKREQVRSSKSNKRVSAYSPTRVYFLTEQNQCSQPKVSYSQKQYTEVNTSILKILKDKQIIK